MSLVTFLVNSISIENDLQTCKLNYVFFGGFFLSLFVPNGLISPNNFQCGLIGQSFDLSTIHDQFCYKIELFIDNGI